MRRFSFFALILALSVFCRPLWAVDEAASSSSIESSDSQTSEVQQQPSTQARTQDPGVAPSRDSAAPVQPEEPKKLNILDVEVRGNQIVSTNTILSKIKTKKDERLVQETVNADLKRLYATGFFQDISIEVEELPDGFKLIIVVDEKPVVRRIDLQGFTVFKEEKLRKEIKLLEGQILDSLQVKQGEEAIRKLYADKGFRFVEVTSDVQIPPGTKEAVVSIRIQEGEKFKIRDIQFDGNQAFKTKQLLKLMKTKRDKWYTSGVFHQEKFQKDVERVKLFYQQEGYLDVKVAPEFDYDETEKKILIVMKIEEGQKYMTGEIKIEGNKLFPESEIWQSLEMLPGLTYSQYYLFKDVESIRDFYHSQGYMDVRIIPDIHLNRDTGKVDVVYKIEEGDLSFVEQVVVRGNTKTKDIVIRRELRIRPGERFDGENIQKSKQRLENLNYFEEITYDTEPVAGATNRKNIIFRVKEKRTGELSFGGGFSSVDSLVGFAEISQKNFDLWNWPRFTGGGQKVSLSARIGTISQDFSFSFVEPYLFNKPYSFGFDLFDMRRDDRNVDFEHERLGFSLTLARTFRDVIQVGTGYTLERVKVDEISSDAPPSVTDFAGVNWLSRIKLFSSYDTRDSIFNPTKGILVNASAELVGSFLGGDQDFYILQAGFTKYWTLFKKHLLEWRTKLGAAQEFGDSSSVPIFDRFYAGGLGTVRGYNFRRVGPIEAGDAVGGETLALMNLEYTFGFPRLEAFRGAVFVDAGHVNSDSYKISFSEIAVSIGPGIKIKTPIGPIALYYGFPIANRDTENENGRFEFSLSRGF